MKTNILFTVLVLLLTNLNGCEDSDHNTLNHGLVAYYPFNGNAMDQSRNENHGTVLGATLTSDRFGDSNSAYYFNGTDASIEVAHDTSLNPQDGITFCSWVNFYDLNNVGAIIEKSRDNLVGHYGLIFAPGYNVEASIRFVEDVYPNAITGFYSTSEVPDLFTWYFLTITYDGEQMSYYFNGQLDSSFTVSKTLGSNHDDLVFGKHPFPGYEYWFHGKIDDIRIYNRALAAKEIFKLYQEK